jgi:hypothetical protein
MLRLFIEDKKGYMETFDNVYKVCIKKFDNKNTLEICYNSLKDVEYIPLTSVKLCFLIDVDTMHEYFRYEK